MSFPNPVEFTNLRVTGNFPDLIAQCATYHNNSAQNQTVSLKPNRTAKWFVNLPQQKKGRYTPQMKVVNDNGLFTLWTNRYSTPGPNTNSGSKGLKGRTVTISTTRQLIQRHKYLRPGVWRIATINKEPHLVSVTAILENAFVVQIQDPDLSFDSWYLTSLSGDKLKPLSITTSETLDQLIINLKRSLILRSNQVETALRTVDRRHFCPENPYHDCAVDIGKKEYGVCISSPHIHVWAAESLKSHLITARKCLDVGSGSGYFTAMMGALAPEAHVYGIEYYKDLIRESRRTLKTHYPVLYENTTFVKGNGESGLPEDGPFDVIHVGFMCGEIPPRLLEQLAPGGRMLIPVANGRVSTYDRRCLSGHYTCVDKDTNGQIHTQKLFVCSFVPSITYQRRKRRTNV